MKKKSWKIRPSFHWSPFFSLLWFWHFSIWWFRRFSSLRCFSRFHFVDAKSLIRTYRFNCRLKRNGSLQSGTRSDQSDITQRQKKFFVFRSHLFFFFCCSFFRSIFRRSDERQCRRECVMINEFVMLRHVERPPFVQAKKKRKEKKNRNEFSSPKVY